MMASKRKVIVISDDEEELIVRVTKSSSHKRRKVIVISDNEEEELEIPTEDEFEDVSDLPIPSISSVSVAFQFGNIINHVSKQSRMNNKTRDSDITQRRQEEISALRRYNIMQYHLSHKKCAIASCKTRVRTYGRDHCSIHHNKIQKGLYGVRGLEIPSRSVSMLVPTSEVSLKYMREARRMLMKKDDTYPAHEKILKLAKRLYKEDNMYM